MSGERQGQAAGFSRVDEILEDAVAAGQAPGVVAGVAAGDARHVATAGLMSTDGPQMGRDTLFRISSITKPMTAAVVLSMVEQGILDLDEPVEGLLPELADRRVLSRPDGPLSETVAARRPITLRDLLTFTWGFGMQGAMFMAAEPWPVFTAALERDLATFGPPRPASTPAPDEWLARLGELPLLAQPGERWLYQSGSQVLGVLASRAAGAPYAEVMATQLFVPLGIGLMLLGGGSPLLAPDTVAEMTRDQLTPEQRTNDWGGFSFIDDRGWGYGVSVLDDGCYGWDGGFGTSWSNVPAQGLTVVVLTQRAVDQTGMPAVCEEVLAAALREL